MVEPEGVGAGSTVERCMTTPTHELEQVYGQDVEVALAHDGHGSPRGRFSPGRRRGTVARVEVGAVFTAVSVDGVRSRAEFLARVRDSGLPGAEATASESAFVFLWLPDSSEWIAVSDWRAAMALLPFGEERITLQLSEDAQPPTTRAWHGQLLAKGQQLGQFGMRSLAALNHALEDVDPAFEFEYDEEDSLLGDGDGDGDGGSAGVPLLLAPAPAVAPNPLGLTGLKRLGVSAAPLLLLGASIVAFNSGNKHMGYANAVQRGLPEHLLLAGVVGMFLTHAAALFLDLLLPDVARSAWLHRCRMWARCVFAAWLLCWAFVSGVTLAARVGDDTRACRQTQSNNYGSADCSMAPVLWGFFLGLAGTVASVPALAEDRATQPAAKLTHVVAGCSERALHTPRNRRAHCAVLFVALLAVVLMVAADANALWNVSAVAFGACVFVVLLEGALSSVVLGRCSLSTMCRVLRLPARGVWIAVLALEAFAALVLLLNGAAGALGLAHREVIRQKCDMYCEQPMPGKDAALIGLWTAALAGALLGALAVVRTAKAARGVAAPSSPPGSPTAVELSPSVPASVEASPRRPVAAQEPVDV